MNYKCIPVPGTSEDYYCGAVNVGLCINSASENIELAKAFLDFAASPEGLEKQYQGYAVCQLQKDIHQIFLHRLQML